jgi:hypothetical protein
MGAFENGTMQCDGKCFNTFQAMNEGGKLSPPLLDNSRHLPDAGQNTRPGWRMSAESIE